MNNRIATRRLAAFDGVSASTKKDVYQQAMEVLMSKDEHEPEKTVLDAYIEKQRKYQALCHGKELAISRVQAQITNRVRSSSLIVHCARPHCSDRMHLKKARLTSTMSGSQKPEKSWIMRLRRHTKTGLSTAERSRWSTGSLSVTTIFQSACLSSAAKLRSLVLLPQSTGMSLE